MYIDVSEKMTKKKEKKKMLSCYISDRGHEVLKFACGNSRFSQGQIVDNLIIQKLSDPRKQIREERQHHVNMIDQLNIKLDALDKIESERKAKLAGQEIQKTEMIK